MREEALADPDSAALGRTTAQSASLSLANQCIRFGVTLAATAALARLLRPDAFGLFAMVLPIAGVAVLLRDLGLSSATIQRPSVRQDQISNLFWMNAMAGGLVAICIWIGAPMVSSLYGEARVTSLLQVVCVGFFIGGLGIQHAALLKRRMMFGRLVISETSAHLAAAGLAIATAYVTRSYWALAVQHIAYEAFVTLGVVVCSKWIPSRPKRDVGITEMLSFGRDMTAASAMTYLIRNSDKALIGAHSGAVSLGYYSKAYQLLMWPTAFISSPLTNVMVPALSRLQSQPARYRTWYRQSVSMMLLITVPLFSMFYVLAPEIVAVLLGAQWQASVEILRALGPAALVTATGFATGWVYVSLGRTRRLAWWTLISGVAILLTFAVSIQFGAIGVAHAFSAVMLLLRIPGVLVCFHGTPLAFRDFLNGFMPPVIIAAIAGLGGHAVATGMRASYSALEVLVVAGLSFFAVWLGSLAVIPSLRNLAKQVVSLCITGGFVEQTSVRNPT